MDELDKTIVTAALLGVICPKSSSMRKLAQKPLKNLQEFINKAEKFMNTEDTIKAPP